MTTLLKRSAIAAALFLASSIGSVAADQPTSAVKIDSGPLQGVDDGTLRSYLGIPYAAPPVGDLRWKPPQAPAAWRETFDATKVGSSCPQNANLGAFATPGGKEDCLFLNVYAPRTIPSGRASLPVFVWIHGGALSVGQSDDHDPRKLALEGRAVVVTLNYRLGMFGFFAHPAIDKEGHPFANYGRMDQSFALDWIQRNITAFGGDKSNVTIAGESSGGSSVIAHVVSPWSTGKFQHAISMSGASEMIKYPNFAGVTPLDAAELKGTNFANAAGCSDQSAACLRSLTVGQILASEGPFRSNGIIDGDFYPTAPGEALRAGKFNNVTLVSGTTRDEGTFFVGFPENETGQPMTEEGFPKAVEAFFKTALTPAVLSEYSTANYNSPSEAYAAAVTDYLFACPALALNRWVSAKSPVYAYEFADRTAPSYLKPTTFPLGAAHTSELQYLFPGYHGGAMGQPVTLNPLQEKLSDEMVRYWTTVANANQWEHWPKYDPSQQNVLRLKLPSSQVLPPGRFVADHHCNFWDQQGIY
ncbi:carboxylesterase type B [Rhizobium sp. PP-F2F-G48]|uniref:carboxylesterase/lipase family protein n=1 Tax=Rhizobium sp. PP-F2F-G48 TaxID=2135651 RepID=UPI0010493992|nr:carboxylesterase family protein [Rhizobium sp. PP-F2F-G48]TCM46343.1 carboxylesterase type B [Rhizobium sp. PP-F2F-G48]